LQIYKHSFKSYCN